MNNNIIMIFLITIIIGLCVWCCCKGKQNIEKFQTNNKKYNCEYIDAVVYINLDNRKDRKKSITKLLSKLNINPKKIHRLSATYNKNNGHKGCADSHIRAIKLAKKNKWSNVLILEDDFQLAVKPKKAVHILDTVFKELGDDWDVVQLAACHMKKEKCKYKYLDNLIRGTTTSGYILSNRLYNSLLKNFKKAYSEIKDDKKYKTSSHAIDQHWSSLQKEKKWYITNPKIGKQGSGHSDILDAKVKYECFTGGMTR